MEIECWRPVPNYEGLYEVSDYGNVKRLGGGRFCRREDHLLAGRPSRNGYNRANLYKLNVKKEVYVHHLVAAVFIGARPDGYEVNHKNGKKGDNRVSNLEYVTKSANVQHALRLKLTPTGQRHYAATLSYNQVHTLRREYMQGASHEVLVAHYAVAWSVHRDIIRAALAGRSWKWLPKPEGWDTDALRIRMAQDRFPSQVGAANHNAKLTDQDVLAIRAAWQQGGVTQRSLAKTHGISEVVVYKIVNGKSWKHLMPCSDRR